MTWYNPFSWGRQRTKEELQQAKLLEDVINDLRTARKILRKMDLDVVRESKQYIEAAQSLILHTKIENAYDTGQNKLLLGYINEILDIFKKYATQFSSTYMDGKDFDLAKDKLEQVIARV